MLRGSGWRGRGAPKETLTRGCLYDSLRGRRTTDGGLQVGIGFPLRPRGKFGAGRLDGRGRRRGRSRCGGMRRRLALSPAAWDGFRSFVDGAPAWTCGCVWFVFEWATWRERRTARGWAWWWWWHEFLWEVLGTPVWRVFAACAVLCFDCHQFGDLMLQCTSLIS